MKITAAIIQRGSLGMFAGGTIAAAAAAALAVPVANADPGNCTAANLSHTVSGVTAAAGSYLDAHPDANDALTAAGSQAPGDAEAALRGYFVGHPQELLDLRGIANPLSALRAQCSQTVSPAQISTLLQAFS